MGGVEEGWRPPESSGAGGNSRTARGRRNGFWPDNAQVTHHLGCLLETVISNSQLAFLCPLIFSPPVLLFPSSYLNFSRWDLSSFLIYVLQFSSFPHHFPLGVRWTLPFLHCLFSAWCLSNLPQLARGIQIPHYQRLDFCPWPAEHQSANIFSLLCPPPLLPH